MAPKKHNPFADFERLSSEIEEMFFRFYGGPRLRVMKGGSFQPLTDVYYIKETNSVIVKLEIAGISPDDARLTVQDKTLIIEGSRVDPKQDGQKVYQQMEIDYGHFKRKIMLPVTVDADNAQASYLDGFLTIEMPVADKSASTINLPITVKDKK
ncbi:MAG: Hsp20/alpha crystallin family protein [Thermoleophilia bacterium]|nr:Hsp20/alpha crystallin family protein [Thermoleophilia bacterium]